MSEQLIPARIADHLFVDLFEMVGDARKSHKERKRHEEADECGYGAHSVNSFV